MPKTNAEVTRDYYQPPDPVVAVHCDECGGEIYVGDIYLPISLGLHEMVLCDECVKKKKKYAGDEEC